MSRKSHRVKDICVQDSSDINGRYKYSFYFFGLQIFKRTSCSKCPPNVMTVSTGGQKKTYSTSEIYCVYGRTAAVIVTAEIYESRRLHLSSERAIQHSRLGKKFRNTAIPYKTESNYCHVRSFRKKYIIFLEVTSSFGFDSK